MLKFLKLKTFKNYYFNYSGYLKVISKNKLFMVVQKSENVNDIL